jgi:hypothetical protein
MSVIRVGINGKDLIAVRKAFDVLREDIEDSGGDVTTRVIEKFCNDMARYYCTIPPVIKAVVDKKTPNPLPVDVDREEVNPDY